MSVATHKESIRERARMLGFDAVGFAAPSLSEEVRQGLREYLDAGHHGEMGWMETHADRRAAPCALWPEVRSVIVLGMNYGPESDPLATLAQPEVGTISVYARHRDYHDLIKGRLKQLAGWLVKELGGEVKVFVDTAPVMEKPLAAQTSLGWQGKHTCVVSRRFGSWLFLGEIFTTLDLPPDTPTPNHCGTCRRCIDICPTQAILAEGMLDARRCISYLTIEHKGHIPHEFRAAMGNRIYGCDDCLAVCPWNSFAQTARELALKARDDLNAPPLAELSALDDATFRRMFSGSPVKRIGRDRFVRNVLIAIGNSRTPALLPAVRARLRDGSPVVRAAAVWALSRLAAPHEWVALREESLTLEQDMDVRDEWKEAAA